MIKISKIVIVLMLVFCEAIAQDKPNILWIVSEDNSPLIGAYGDEFATTPNIDQFAASGVRYTRAFATAPVCAPARSTIITGVYPTAMGTQHMRSTNPVPSMIRFFPGYLRDAGYYTTNNSKKDYNTVDQPEVWDESSNTATYKNRRPGQPFFAVFNITISHESSLHQPADHLRHDPEQVPIPPYHPKSAEMRHDWAQYYDKIEDMDARVGEILQELEDAGLADSTIVFYYSDHGGVLGRSKRYLYESGLQVPLIIHFPECYKELAPDVPGASTDRIVTFVDFAPTILSLANIDVPPYMQGQAFLGKQQTAARDFAFAFRGRMDERIDIMRSVRDKKYRYIRNYMPHKIYGQYLEYLWKAPSMASWERLHKEGTLNEVQSRFWNTKPVEELYDVQADPHNVLNLALDPEYADIMDRMRKANKEWMLQTLDLGFIPEAMFEEVGQPTLYEYARSGNYKLREVIETAELASFGAVENLPLLLQRLEDPDPVLRYWAATGCAILGENAKPAAEALRKALNDPQVAVRIAAAEALYALGEKDQVLKTLTTALQNPNKMARVQALNVLENMENDALPVMTAIEALTSDKLQDQDYDIRAANRLVQRLNGMKE
jgi:N-sulfoglucosamine sulfohydrolase